MIILTLIKDKILRDSWIVGSFHQKFYCGVLYENGINLAVAKLITFTIKC